MTSSPLPDKKLARRRSDLALVVTGLLTSVGVYFGHPWFHEGLLPLLGITAPMGDALGSVAIVLVALTSQRLASLVIFRDVDFGLSRLMLTHQQTNEELRKVLGDLEHLATTDKLTGCWNRHYLETIVPGEIARFARSGQALSLLVIDVDHFKRINDVHGHGVGDRVLVELARRLQLSLRASDSLVRWGGEEFIIFCPTTSLISAITLAERAKALICREDIDGVGPVTISIGVAECLDDETWQEWFDRADAALYRAKNNGRNRIQVALASREKNGNPAAPAHLVRLVWHGAYRCGHDIIDQEH